MKIMFVCLGNICRSPTAHGIALTKAEQRQKDYQFASSGTSAYHIGEPPDSRSVEHAKRRGYDLSSLRAQQLTRDDFNHYDLVLTMDEQNYQDALNLCPPGSKANLRMLLDFHPSSDLKNVPDPYYGGSQGFDNVIELCEQAINALFDQLDNASLNAKGANENLQV